MRYKLMPYPSLQLLLAMAKISGPAPGLDLAFLACPAPRQHPISSEGHTRATKA